MAQTDALPIYALPRHFPVRMRPASRLSDDELFDLCAQNPSLRIERTKEGELIIMSPTGAETGRRNFLLIGQLSLWVARDGTGVGFDSSTGFLLPNGAERSPDAAWVHRARWGALSPDQRRKFAPLCPDFVVELRSPSDSLPELFAKMREYVECGARLAWLIDVDGGRAWIFRPKLEVESIENAKTISGDPELPGLVLDLAALH
jgi:Uma2 family endonuclease